MIHGSMRHYASGRKKKYNAWSKPKRKEQEFKEYVPSYSNYRETPDYPSLTTSGPVSTERQEPKQYTGTLIKGISTMHKSNAVPIISEEEAKEHASMRR
jgi:hypothetical protein